MIHSNATGQIPAGTAFLQGYGLRPEIPPAALPIVKSFVTRTPVSPN